MYKQHILQQVDNDDREHDHIYGVITSGGGFRTWSTFRSTPTLIPPMKQKQVPATCSFLEIYGYSYTHTLNTSA